MRDLVKKPTHYTGQKVEHFDALESACMNWPQNVAPHLTHAFSYVYRCGSKDDPAQEISKAISWLERALIRLKESD